MVFVFSAHVYFDDSFEKIIFSKISVDGEEALTVSEAGSRGDNIFTPSPSPCQRYVRLDATLIVEYFV